MLSLAKSYFKKRKDREMRISEEIKRKKDKIRGCLVGLAIGDALGAPVEKWSAERIKEKHGRVEGYVASKRVEPGHWTDDTAMSLAVARGIVVANSKWQDVLPMIANEHLVDWRNNRNSGYGRTTKKALTALDNGVSFFESGNNLGMGNGVAMRIAPFALWLSESAYRNYHLSQFLRNPEIISFLRAFGRITHTNPYSLITGMLQAEIVAQCFGCWHYVKTDFTSSVGRYLFAEGILEQARDFERFYCDVLFERKLSSKIMAGLDFKKQLIKSDDVLLEEVGVGFSAIESCPFAWLTALNHAESFRDGVLAAVNAGGDADTTASMVGAILGSLYGLEEIQKTGWCEGLWQYDEIVALADSLSVVLVQ